jgi:hypothetical protein
VTGCEERISLSLVWGIMDLVQVMA